MKLPSLISKLLLKAAPMTNVEHSDISTNMEVWFDKKKEAVRVKESLNEELTIFDKFFKLIDEWYLRALFAILFVYFTRVIQDWMNPGDDEDDEHDMELPDVRR